MKAVGGVRKQHSPTAFFLRKKTLNFTVHNAKVEDIKEHVFIKVFAELF